MDGARKRGRPRQIWVDTLKGYASGATISNMRRDARDRAGWRGATTAVARGRMRLDGTNRVTSWAVPEKSGHVVHGAILFPRLLMHSRQNDGIL